MSETAPAEALGSSEAEKIARYFVIGGVLLVFAIPSALVLIDWLPNSFSTTNLILGVLGASLNVFVSLVNFITPWPSGYVSLVASPEVQLYIASIAGFYGLVFLLAGVLGGAAGPREYFGGAALVAVAIFAYIAARDLGQMRGFAFGPGTAPRMFAYVLGALGLAVAGTGVTTKGPPIERFHLRGPFFITLSVVVFALTVRSFGLALSSFLSICAAAGATPEARIIETVICGVVLTAFCCLLFPYALNLPMPLWPVSYDPLVLIKSLSIR
jgi:putative tricarboxylic transport membrane protein